MSENRFDNPEKYSDYESQCTYSHSTRTQCKDNGSGMKCETTKKVYRNCPNRPTEEVESVTETLDGPPQSHAGFSNFPTFPNSSEFRFDESDSMLSNFSSVFDKFSSIFDPFVQPWRHEEQMPPMEPPAQSMFDNFLRSFFNRPAQDHQDTFFQERTPEIFEPHRRGTAKYPPQPSNDGKSWSV